MLPDLVKRRHPPSTASSLPATLPGLADTRDRNTSQATPNKKSVHVLDSLWQLFALWRRMVFKRVDLSSFHTPVEVERGEGTQQSQEETTQAQVQFLT